MTVTISLRRRDRQPGRTQLAALALVAAMTAFAAGPGVAAKGELRPVKGAVVAGDFIAQDLQGRPARFGELRGDVQDARVPRAQGSAGAAKVVLLNFWATWCPPCRKEMPSMEALHRAYRDRGLVVLAVSQDQTSSRDVKTFVDMLDLSFPVWHDRDGLVGRQYSIPGVPTSFLIGRDGRVAWRVLGEYDWASPAARAAVEQLLGK